VLVLNKAKPKGGASNSISTHWHVTCYQLNWVFEDKLLTTSEGWRARGSSQRIECSCRFSCCHPFVSGKWALALE
jgi:hypothetical protein